MLDAPGSTQGMWTGSGPRVSESRSLLESPRDKVPKASEKKALQNAF